MAKRKLRPIPKKTERTDDVWNEVFSSADFQALVKAKIRVIVPTIVFFITYYFALPVLVGYAPGFMERKVIGTLNLAYLFALSQFFVAWIIAALYLRWAARFDTMAASIVSKHTKPDEEKSR
jgi:uncharacterized membrane protein (DUF485 family)